MIRNINIQIFKNTRKDLSFYIYDNSGELVDITGWTGRIRVYLQTPGEADTNILNKSLTISTTVKGLCTVTLDEDDTDIDEYVYTYVLEFDTGSGEYENYGFGILEIVGDDDSRISQIKLKYGLDYDYYVMKEALNDARKKVLNYALINEENIYSSKDTEFKLENYTMDSTFSYDLDNSDISVIQYQTESPYNEEDLSSEISSIKFNHPSGYTIVTLNNEYPEDTYKLKISYYRGAKTYSDIIENIRLLEEYYTIYYLFSNLPIYKLQRGLSSRTINGITVDFDQQGVKDVLEQLQRMINREIIQVKPFKSQSVLISKEY